MINGIENGHLTTGFVKLVDAEWEPTPLDEDKEPDIFEPIDGCKEKHVGWMRIAPHMIGADLYDGLEGDWNYWDIFYYICPLVS